MVRGEDRHQDDTLPRAALERRQIAYFRVASVESCPPRLCVRRKRRTPPWTTLRLSQPGWIPLTNRRKLFEKTGPPLSTSASISRWAMNPINSRTKSASVPFSSNSATVMLGIDIAVLFCNSFKRRNSSDTGIITVIAFYTTPRGTTDGHRGITGTRRTYEEASFRSESTDRVGWSSDSSNTCFVRLVHSVVRTGAFSEYCRVRVEVTLRKRESPIRGPRRPYTSVANMVSHYFEPCVRRLLHWKR